MNLKLNKFTSYLKENNKEDYAEQFVTIFKEKMKKVHGIKYLNVNIGNRNKKFIQILFSLKGSMSYKIDELYKIFMEQGIAPDLEIDLYCSGRWYDYSVYYHEVFDLLIDNYMYDITDEEKRKTRYIIILYIVDHLLNEKEIIRVFKQLFADYNYELLYELLKDERIGYYKYLLKFNDLHKIVSVITINYLSFDNNIVNFIKLMESLYTNKQLFITEMVMYYPEIILNNNVFEYVHTFDEFHCHIQEAFKKVFDEIISGKWPEKDFWLMEYGVYYTTYNTNHHYLKLAIFKNKKFYNFINKEQFMNVFMCCYYCISRNTCSTEENSVVVLDALKVASEFIDINEYMDLSKLRIITLNKETNVHPLLYMYIICIRNKNIVYSFERIAKWWFENYYKQIIYLNEYENNIYHYIEEAKWLNCFNRILDKVTCGNNEIINNHNKCEVTPYQTIVRKIDRRSTWGYGRSELYKLRKTKEKFEEYINEEL